MKLTPFRQQQPHTCLPACVRIVLDYWGQKHEEAELAQACGSVPVWETVPSEVVDGLEQMGYRALWFENASLERLMALLDQNWPVIVFLRAADLPHGRAGLHSVVVTGLQAGNVIYIDPARGVESRMSVEQFVRAWSALDNQGMVVWVPWQFVGESVLQGGFPRQRCSEDSRQACWNRLPKAWQRRARQ